MRLLLTTWHNQGLHITTGLEIITFASVYVNLELTVNETFVAHGTMVGISATLKSLWPRGVKVLKNKCPIRNTFFLLCMGHLNF